MYGLLIVEGNRQVTKVASSKEKIYSITKRYIQEYLNCKKIKAKGPEYSELLNALKINEIEMAIELFSYLTEKNNKQIFLTLSKVEFELDS